MARGSQCWSTVKRKVSRWRAAIIARSEKAITHAARRGRRISKEILMVEVARDWSPVKRGRRTVGQKINFKSDFNRGRARESRRRHVPRV